MRFMFDSVTPEAIPRTAEMVAGYIDGTISHQWGTNDWKMFPYAVKVRIARVPETNDGHVLDVEPNVNGGEWPPGSRMISWVMRRRSAGIIPTIYCNQLNDWNNVRNVFRNARIPEPLYWVARYNNVADIPAGAIAKQFAHPPQLGFNADKSAVADYWPGVDRKQEMALNDELFSFTTPDGRSVSESALKMLGNLYAAEFYGSNTEPWKGASTRELMLALQDADATVIAGLISEQLIAAGVSGATPEQVTEALRTVFRSV